MFPFCSCSDALILLNLFLEIQTYSIMASYNTLRLASCYFGLGWLLIENTLSLPPTPVITETPVLSTWDPKGGHWTTISGQPGFYDPSATDLYNKGPIFLPPVTISDIVSVIPVPGHTTQTVSVVVEPGQITHTISSPFSTTTDNVVNLGGVVSGLRPLLAAPTSSPGCDTAACIVMFPVG